MARNRWLAVCVLIGALMAAGTAPAQQRRQTTFSFCNEQPITLKVYVIRTVFDGALNSPLAGNVLQTRRYEGTGWRSVRPGTCFSVQSLVGLHIALSLNYDFGDEIEPVSIAENDDPQSDRTGFAPTGETFCVQRYDDTEPLTVIRDDLNGFLPRGDACDSIRLEKRRFSVVVSIARGDRYDIRY